MASSTVHVVFTGQALLSQQPMPGIVLTLCAKLDADCLLPIAQYQSDQAGKFDVELPAGFDGYFQMEGNGIYPTLFMTTALNCLGAPAAGMVLASSQVDDHTVTYFLQGGLPSLSAPSTDESGAGGFVNIKAGDAVLTSTIAATNRLAGTVAVQTRPGHLTMVLVVPTGG